MQVAEALFDPSVLGLDGPGIPEVAIESATVTYDPMQRRAGVSKGLVKHAQG